MIVLNNLASQVETARNEIIQSSKGILGIKQRMKIQIAMVDRQDAELSYRMRIHLQERCVRHVQSLWVRAFPDNDSLENMLTLVHQVINREIDVHQAELRAYSFFQSFDRAATNPANESAIMVADAAQQLVISACYRDPYADIDESLEDDDDLLPDSLDCSYACSCAVAGGMNWRPANEVNVEARRAFWLWYLDEAIPAVLRG